MTEATRERIDAMPKVELHVHIEACISADSIEELASAQGVPMIRPKEQLYRYTSFAHFLSTYEWWVDLLRTEEIAEKIAYDAARQFSDDGIIYAEVFTGPRYWAHLDYVPLIEAQARGYDRAHQEGYADCRILPSISREQSPEWAMELVNWLGTSAPDRVVGVGLDGNEKVLGRTSPKFEKAFARAHELGLGRSAHCGESSGPEGVWDGLNYLHLDRVDHGVRSSEDPDLVRHLADNQIPLTICPTSNAIVGFYETMEDGPIDMLYKAGVPVTVNSDDPLAMNLSINGEFEAVCRAYDWTMSDVFTVSRHAIDAAFCNDSDKDRLRASLSKYERSVMA